MTVPTHGRSGIRRDRVAQRTPVRRPSSFDPPTAEQQGELLRFFTRFEELADVLRESCQYGPSGPNERAYTELREWMIHHYASVRTQIAPYLEAKRSAMAALSGGWSDEVETLFSPPTLSELLRGDDGSLLGRLMRAREAVGMVFSHLRALASAC
ncbi:MAG TPA: hypothetical protein PLH94_00535 [Fimbriimonadaceae bacterium]|nr:hypothetical protein [Fimbriimonadaceae bacterium]